MSTIRTRDLTAGYNGAAVVHGLELVVGEGEVVGLFGANGAGKSTTLWTIAGIFRPMRGTVEVFGHPVPFGAPYRMARAGLAMVPEDRGLFFGLTVRENLAFRRKRGSSARTEQRVLEHFPALAPMRDRRAGLLSGGEQQMLALACALVSEPRAIIIDEMSLGLAPVLVERLMPIVRRLADDGLSVLLVEQHVEAALQVVDRGYVLSRGAIVMQGTKEEPVHRRDLLELSYLGENTDHHPRPPTADAAVCQAADVPDW